MATSKKRKAKPKKTTRGSLVGLTKDVAKIADEYRKDEHFDDNIGPDEIIIYMGHEHNVILKSIERRLKNIEKLLQKKKK